MREEETGRDGRKAFKGDGGQGVTSRNRAKGQLNVETGSDEHSSVYLMLPCAGVPMGARA